MAYGNADSTFVAIIDQNGYIRDMSAGRRGEIIGVDYQKEQEYQNTIKEMQEVMDSWRPKMIEHGYIVEPKTPEMIAQEAAAEQLRIAQEQSEQQAQINQALLSAIENLNAEVKELRGDGSCRCSSKSCAEQSGDDSASSRKATGGNKGSDKSGSKATS